MALFIAAPNQSIAPFDGIVRIANNKKTGRRTNWYIFPWVRNPKDLYSIIRGYGGAKGPVDLCSARPERSVDRIPIEIAGRHRFSEKLKMSDTGGSCPEKSDDNMSDIKDREVVWRYDSQSSAGNTRLLHKKLQRFLAGAKV